MEPTRIQQKLKPVYDYIIGEFPIIDVWCELMAMA